MLKTKLAAAKGQVDMIVTGLGSGQSRSKVRRRSSNGSETPQVKPRSPTKAAAPPFATVSIVTREKASGADARV